jgi:hypothetical protein
MDVRMLTTRSTVPAPVRSAVMLWLLAIGAGIADALLVTGQAMVDGTADRALGLQLAVHSLVSAGLVLLVLRLWNGGAIWRTLNTTLIGVGTSTVLIGPIAWLADGHSPVGFFAAADSVQLVFAGLRAAQLLLVTAALIQLYRPAANEFFRQPITPRGFGFMAMPPAQSMEMTRVAAPRPVAR